MIYDKIIFGAGLYGLYSALRSGEKGDKVLLLEYDDAPFKRASYINQARVHMGYHYPRSYSTAIKSAGYFEKFNSEFQDSILAEFNQVYATSSALSWTDDNQFEKFCMDANIPCDRISPMKYFQSGKCSGAFLTKEYTYDAAILLKTLMERINKYPEISIIYNSRIKAIKQVNSHYDVILQNGAKHSTEFIINTTYASVNQVLSQLDYSPFKIKYEICEIILCNIPNSFINVGVTVMDGPFFSLMPFGKTGLHSLTSVTFTPHKASFDSLPTFGCQATNKDYCSPKQLGNCNSCSKKPKSAWDYMSALAKKYLIPEFRFDYNKSLFSIKPILMASEIDDSRPTIIKVSSESPKFVSILSGKINTIYDIDEVL